MFNLYSKLTTAFLAFAIIFSTNTSAQVLSYNGFMDGYDSEVGFTVTDCDGNVLLEVIAGDLPNGTAQVIYDDLVLPEDFTITMTDDWGDGWGGNFLAIDTDNGATDSWGDGCSAYSANPGWCAGYDDDDFMSMNMCGVCGANGGQLSAVDAGPTVFTSGSCGLPPCEDPAACNVGEEGECTYPAEGFDCEGNIICAEGQTTISFGGGGYQNEATWSITACDESLAVLLTGGGADSQDCLVLPDSYTVTLNDSWGDGWNGNVLVIGDVSYTLLGDDVNDDGVAASFFVGEGDSCPVCADENACNFNGFGECTYAAEGFDCDGNALPSECIELIYTVNPGDYPSEITWAILDADGNVVLNGDAGVNGVSGTVCLEAACYTLIGQDSWGDGWTGGAGFILTSGNEEIVNWSLDFDPEIEGSGDSGSTDFCVSSDVLGCTDEAASNYNPAATIDDDSCCFGDIVTINLYDSFDDGWGWGEDGDGSFDGGMMFNGEYFPFMNGSSASFDFCLAAGCYEADLLLDLYPGEASWDVVVGGQTIAFGSEADLFFSTDPSCVVLGCTDDIACNYNPDANTNDFSCDYESCAGCTDQGACNYDMDATLLDDSCDYSCVGCMDNTAINYDADATIPCEDCCSYCEGAFAGILNVGGGSYDGEIGWTLTLFGDTVAVGGAGAFVLCLEAGCYQLDMTDSWGDGWNLGTYSFNGYDGVTAYSGDLNTAAEGDGLSVGTDFINFSGGDCIYGCTDEGACNYDATAAYDDDSCDYTCVGCTDADAANYDLNATIDSGNCTYCADDAWVMTVSMTDSFGDGWNGAAYTILSQDGTEVASGSLDNAFSGDLSSGYDLICLVPGCYTVEVTNGDWPTEVGVSLSDQFGYNYGSFGAGATYPVDFLFTGQCGFEGCTSPTAINYNISASFDDGSCQEPPANDQLDNAEPVFCGAYASGSLLYATDDQGLLDAGSGFGNADVNTAGVWYVFNSDANQQVVVSTCDTPVNDGETTNYTTNTQLHVFTMGADGGLNAISSNDNGCPTGLLSTAAFNAVTGADYYIYVSEAFEGSTGDDFVLSVQCDTSCLSVPTNDNCDGAIAQVSGVTFTGSTCCASPEAIDVSGWAGTASSYGVWFTFNSGNYDTFYFDATNVTDGQTLGFVMMEGNSCETLVGFVGCVVTGTCAGSVEGFLPELTPNQDYWFLIFNTDPTACGEFEFTTTGINFGCTDATANNYDPDANQDNGSCDFDGVVPVNDTCAGAITLECNTVTTGSTGGSTSTGAPVGVDGCEVSPGNGVWYTFEGDGQLHNISTCGSSIDSKINIYTADIECGGGSIDTPPADECGEGFVTVNLAVGGGDYDGEISWLLYDSMVNLVAQGGTTAGGGAGNFALPCLVDGEDYTLVMNDSWGDGWNGASAQFTNALGETIGLAGLDDGSSGNATISVAAYSMEPTFIAGDFDCFAAAVGSDGTGACTLFDSDDVNFEFVSTPGQLYYVYVGAQDADGDPTTDDNGTFDIVFDCTPVVEGCMNTAACNYEETANVSTDTCDFWSCVCDETEGVAIMLNMQDSFGDGWDGAVYTISDLMGNLVAEGSLDDAQFFVDENNFAGPESGLDMICLAAGCYIIDVTAGDWPAEVSWDIMLEDGSTIAAGFGDDSQTISVGGAICGCTNSGACNFNPDATIEDGSCEFETCAGCTDSASCSYDDTATIDDGSCCYSNCVDIQMIDSFGDGWNGASYVLSSVDGNVVGTGTMEVGANAIDSYCLADGCYTISVDEGSWPTEISWNVLGAFEGQISGVAATTITFNVGTGDQCVVGCDVSCACNYDPAANISDVTQCVFDGCDGCTYPDASNYDETAVSDNGTCVFDIANPCPADLNGDGAITTGDLLVFLAAFGTDCE